MARPVEINEESMEDYLRNTDEERIAIINYYIAVAKGEFSREYQQVFSKVDEKMQAKANFESQLENFRKIKVMFHYPKKIINVWNYLLVLFFLFLNGLFICYTIFALEDIYEKNSFRFRWCSF